MQQAILLISILLFCLYGLLLIYYRLAWHGIPDYKPQTTNPEPQIKITLIIPARNEEASIPACLHSLQQQTYPSSLFEVLVVDDHSTDSTAGLVKGFVAGNIRLISLQEFTGNDELNSYKKKAIETAIGESTGELIVTTDADCIFPKNWLHTIACFYTGKRPAFIVMPVRFRTGNHAGAIFQALDFMALQGITGAAVYKKVHSMCNGANLAYTRKAFREAGGFANIDRIASGDDMLLLHKIYKQHPDGIQFLKSADVIVETQPMHSLKDFFNQRIRWASKAAQYDDKRIFWVLLLVYFLNCWCLVLGIAACFSCSILFWFIGLLACKTAVELFFLYPVAGFFHQRSLLWWFPLAQPFHIVYTIIAGWLGKFGSYEWKGRKVS